MFASDWCIYTQAWTFTECMKAMASTEGGLGLGANLKCLHDFFDVLVEVPFTNNRGTLHKDNWLIPFRI